MLTGLAWLGLEVKYLEPARRFYEETLELSVRLDGRSHPALVAASGATDTDDGISTDTNDGEGDAVVFRAGESDIVLRRPTSLPRGGVHTHFACSIPAAEYDDWWERLDGAYDLDEHTFGDARSLYLYDPDGNCVELGQTEVAGPGIDGIFEIVLEVADLEAAEARYAELGFETVDRGDDRQRVRMNGPMALELWEPQLGLADARGGLHVDLGFETDDLEAVEKALGRNVCSLERTDSRLVARDPDGHHLTFLVESGEG
ncbi:VOC family protein [Natronosalvus vescus]|uniref:VOC family protein n=1 Tax=Natronosalvus vescus TaxID=2953881 RepID=UPI00209013B9|nr:VOC family protein [Natronosalvus vescus]